MGTGCGWRQAGAPAARTDGRTGAPKQTITAAEYAQLKGMGFTDDQLHAKYNVGTP